MVWLVVMSPPLTATSPVTVNPLLTVVVPPSALPILILVVEPAAPPVPKLIVLVVADATAPVEIFVVLAAVLVYPSVSAVELANAPKVAPPSMVVVNVGAVPNTSKPLPVSSLITPANSDDDVDANAESLSEVVAKVPVVGRVTLVLAVVVTPRVCAPV